MKNRRPVYILQPPANLQNVTTCLDDKQFGLGILALGAFLKQQGFPVKGIHFPNVLSQKDKIFSDIIEDIARDHPLLIAIGLNWVHFSRGALDLARLLRTKCPDVPIVVGGQHATLFTTQIAEKATDCIDAVLNGEAETTLHAICCHLHDTGRLLEKLPGMYRTDPTQQNRAVVAPQVIENIDDLPFYDYDFLQLPTGSEKVAALSTCRGSCPFKCSFCVEHVIGNLQGRHKLTFHSADWIASHIKHLYDQGIKRITIQDSFFIAGDRLILETADALAKKNIQLDHINIFSHPCSYSRQGFEAMKQMAKWASVDFGIETGSAKVMEIVKRPGNLNAVVNNIKTAADVGVVPYTWWLTGLPDAPNAEKDTRHLIWATMQAGGIPRWVSPLVLLPQTPMYENAVEYGITPRFSSFEDFSRFSEVSLAEALHFGDTITHSTEERTINQILSETTRFKKYILENFSIVEQSWTGKETYMFDNFDQIKSRIEASFF